jgi:hypothetical protein
VGTFEVESGSFDADHIAAHASSFDRAHFKARFAEFVREQIALQRPAEIQRAVNALA